MVAEYEESIGSKYEIVGKLREGGMGPVYRVRHRLLDEPRVVKVLRPHLVVDREVGDRFKQEARKATRLRHPNLVELFDFSLDEYGNGYFVMEFVEGSTLRELLDRGHRLSVGLAVRLTRQCLSVLAYLHQQEIIHCNMAPDQLMLTRDSDGEPMIKLIDLGIARYTGGEMRHGATGVFLGQAGYSAPERFQPVGTLPPECQCDVYSVGVILYELLTRKLPFAGKGFIEQASGHLFGLPRDFLRTDSDGRVPEPLRQVVLKALEKDPANRMATVEDFGVLLEPFDPDTPLKEDLKRLLEGDVVEATEELSTTAGCIEAQFGLDDLSEARIEDSMERWRWESSNSEALTGSAVRRLRLPTTDAVASGATEVESLLVAGELDMAARRLEGLVDELGQAAAFTRLAKRVSAGRDRERVRQHLMPPSETTSFSCFVSYSHDDSVFALRLCEQFEERGIRCWLDEKDARVGDPIQEAIDQGLEATDRVLLCCSRASLDSTWVHREITKTFAKEEAQSRTESRSVRRLIPLDLDGYLFEQDDSGGFAWTHGWADEIRNRLAADFTGWETDDARFEVAFERVVEALRPEA